MIKNSFFLILLSTPFAYSFATLPRSSTISSLKSISRGGTDTSLRMQEGRNIAVVGCGVLGTSLCKQLLLNNDDQGSTSTSTITGITKTTNNHESIKKAVGDDDSSTFHLSTFDDIPKQKQFSHVVFCAPPSGFDDYPSAIQKVIDELWAGPEKGAFVFTSSGGIYGPGDGETVSETTTIPTPESPRTKRLVQSELNVIAAGGCVLRLAGLYTLERGAHSYWLEKSGGQVKGSKDGIINLLHYDDAAGACVAALGVDVEQTRGKIFLISDGNPTTRYGICESALKSKRYNGASIPTFGDEENAAGKGKVYDGHWSNEVLSWKSKYASFDEFMTNSQ